VGSAGEHVLQFVDHQHPHPNPPQKGQREALQLRDSETSIAESREQFVRVGLLPWRPAQPQGSTGREALRRSGDRGRPSERPRRLRGQARDRGRFCPRKQRPAAAPVTSKCWLLP